MILPKYELKSFSKISTALLLFLFACGDGNKKEKIETILPLTFEDKVTGIKDGDTYKVFTMVQNKLLDLLILIVQEKGNLLGVRRNSFLLIFALENMLL